MRRVVAPPAVEYRRALDRVVSSLRRADRAAQALGLQADADDLAAMGVHARSMLVAHRAAFPGQTQMPSRTGDTISGC